MTTNKDEAPSHVTQTASAVMYGVINGILTIPVTISFCSIIFRDNVFAEHMPKLVKLVLFSSAIHQISFSIFSSLPFAVGQVQDAGLIFLSAIAASIVESCDDPEKIMATTLFVLAICTFLLGCMLLVVSKLKLASIIQYLPMPVIGGYLAYIGFFCGEAGLAMMGGITEPGIGHYLHPHAMFLMAPGLCIGCIMYILLRNVRSPFVLPTCMAGILLAFYGLMWVMGGSFEDARHFGWIAPLSPVEPFYHSWKLYDVNLVDWSQLPDQVVRLTCMFLVVAFSSSLDVAAIEMEVGLPLDYNTELFTVGMSNVISGLTGGYTGSYIFSQTIFNLRRRVNSRICGYTIAVCELAVVVMPVSITSYIPKLFFGSLLVLIAVDLMTEWLIGSRTKMTKFEYAVCLMTFFSILFTGIEIGMLIGVLLAMASFVVTYARLQTVSVASLLSSTVVRTFEERAILIANRGKVVTISLNGYIFFGSAVNILEEVKSHVIIQQAEVPVESPPMSVDRANLLTIALKEGKSKTEGETKPLLANHMRTLSYSGHNPAPLHDTDFDYFQSNKMMPRYSFSLSKHPPTPQPHAGRPPTKRHPSYNSVGSAHEIAIPTPQPSLFARSHQNNSILNQSYQNNSSVSSGIIASLLYSHSNRSSCTGSDADLSPNNSNHKPGKAKKERTVSFDATQKASNPDGVSPTAANAALGDIGVDNSRAHTMAECMAEAAKLSKDKEKKKHTKAPPLPLPDTNKPHHRGQEDPAQQPVSQIISQVNNQQSSNNSIGNSNDNNDSINSSNSSSLMKSSSGNSTSSPKKKSKSLFAAIWENQTVKREKLQGTIADLSPNRTRANSQQRDDESTFTKISRNHSGSFSPVNTRREQPKASVLKQVSAFPDIDYEKTTNEDGNEVSTEYLVLDFTHVLGVDATAARSCFMMLVQLMKASEVTVVFAHMSPAIESMFRSQRVVKDDDIVIPNLDDALEWCEEQVLHSFLTHNKKQTSAYESDPKRNHSYYTRAHKQRQQQSTLRSTSSRSGSFDLSEVMSNEGLLMGFSGGAGGGAFYKGSNNEGLNVGVSPNSSRCESRDEMQPGNQSEVVVSLPVNPLIASVQPSSAKALRKILADYLETDSGSNPLIDSLLTSELLLKYFRRVNYTDRELVFDVGDSADQVYFIEHGVVEIVTISATSSSPTTPSPITTSAFDSTPRIQHNTRINSKSILTPPVIDSSHVQRVNKVSAGGAFGEADFFLGRQHSVRAFTLTNCDCWLLDRESYANMEMQHPSLCLLIQHTLLKSLSISSTCNMYSLNSGPVNNSNNR